MAEDKILWVARYAEGDMDENELAAFEASLLTDTDLQQQLKEYQDIREGLAMQLADDQKIKQTLKEIAKPYFTDQQKAISVKLYSKWLVAVAAILVVGLFLWAPWNSDLYAEYADYGQMLVTERGAEQQTNLDKAAAFFNDKNYIEAEKLLEKEYASQPQNEIVGYYYGITLIENEKEVAGRVVLTKIYNNESAFKYDAAYDIALSFVKQDNHSEAIVWLKKIPAGTSNAVKATALMNKLK